MGSLSYVDDSARARAASAIKTGRTVSLARELVPGESLRKDSSPAFSVEFFYTEEPVGTWAGPGAGTGTDHLRLDCHGIGVTHMDALRHTAIDHTFYGGIDVDDPDASSTWEQRDGVFTRAFYIDFPALRGTPWVEIDEPVTGREIEAAISGTGLSLERGDALALNMGRHNWEAAGHPMSSLRRPGLGEDAAHWLSTQPVSMICWDFLDVKNGCDAVAAVHLLNWAQGLILVDNCTFAEACEVLPGPVCVVAVIVLPLPIRGATGCAVNPLLIV
jgi:kynurenine formamidase